ncbi:hypothetical protein [Flavobacterium rhizosphaerae]|uniref:Lipocalin-like domain-containing protein n=1 Tax=Flavobacterium rhizosphaerae TaxID=3163298 RepID=A0ABW8YV29_9FLAO
MKNIYILVLFITFTVHSQTEKDIIGHWKFQSVQRDGNTDDSKAVKVAELLSSLEFVFKINMLYENQMMEHYESGTWSVANSIIYFKNTYEGANAEYTVKIKAFSHDALTFDFKGVTIVLARQPDKVDANLNFDLVKQWNLIGVRPANSLNSDDITPIPEGNFILLTANSNYTISFGGNIEQGVWKYDEKEHLLALQGSNAIKTWKVINITGNELVLVMGATGEEFVFSAD